MWLYFGCDEEQNCSIIQISKIKYSNLFHFISAYNLYFEHFMIKVKVSFDGKLVSSWKPEATSEAIYSSISLWTTATEICTLTIQEIYEYNNLRSISVLQSWSLRFPSDLFANRLLWKSVRLKFTESGDYIKNREGRNGGSVYHNEFLFLSIRTRISEVEANIINGWLFSF